jgi:hypothetical protein
LHGDSDGQILVREPVSTIVVEALRHPELAHRDRAVVAQHQGT